MWNWFKNIFKRKTVKEFFIHCDSCTDFVIKRDFERKPITAYEYIKVFHHLPGHYRITNGENKGKISNKEIRRSLEQGAITINGLKPKPEDIVDFPITELVFFKGSKHQVIIF